MSERQKLAKYTFVHIKDSNEPKEDRRLIPLSPILPVSVSPALPVPASRVTLWFDSLIASLRRIDAGTKKSPAQIAGAVGQDKEKLRMRS